ncbi:MAG: hypothetical protein BMS9Abin05_0009 [Rhodothermia bacterium]|nr:MAG: hypothetical protein BMS9Abin05_0009 [Rhodothermia bacterium]
MKILSQTVLSVAVVATVIVSCQTEPEGLSTVETSRVFEGAGRISELLPGGQHVKITHGQLGDFMEAMEMSFEIADTLHLVGATQGDSIHFSLRVQPDGYFFIEDLEVVR